MFNPVTKSVIRATRCDGIGASTDRLCSGWVGGRRIYAGL